MPSAGSITLDAKLNTNSLKNQVTKLGKSIGAINLKFNIANQNKVLKTQAQIKAQAKSTLTLEQAINNTIKSQTNNMNKLRAAAEKRLAKDKQLYDNAAKINQIYQNNAASNVSGNEQIAQIKQMQSLQSTVNTVSNSTNNLTKGLNVASQITNSLASGSNSLIQGITSVASTLGGIIGTAASGGNAAIGGIVSTVISVLGNVAKIVANIVTGIVNTVIKIIKGGIGIIKNMFNFFKDLPDYISKAISKLGEMSLTFKALSGVINYCKSLAQQFMSIIGQKFNAYSIMNFVEDSFEMGSSITEQSHILKTIIPEFMAYQDALGGTSEYLLYMSEVTSKLGISQVNATKYLAGYASMWKSLGIDSNEQIKEMSKNMLQLTSDIASFKDMDYENVYSSLKSIIFGGQTRTGLNTGVDIYVESMKKYLASLDITIDDSSSAMEKYCASIGKVWTNMTAAEKSVVRLQKVMSDLSFMSGDFSKTSYTWANQVRFLKEQFTNLKAVIGENLIMVFNWLLTVINNVMAALNACAIAMNNFLKSLGLGWILQSSGNDIAKAIGEETDALNDAAESVGGAGSGAAKEIQRSLMPFDKLMNKLDKDTSSSGGGGGSSASANMSIAPTSNPFEEMLEDTDNLITKAINRLKESLKKVKTFFSTLWTDFTTEFATPFGEFLKGENGIPRLINNIADLIDGIDWNKLNTSFRLLFASLEPVAETIWNIGLDIQEYLINPLTQFYTNKILPSIVDAFSDFNRSVKWEKVRKGISNVIKALEPLLETIISINTYIFTDMLLPIGKWFMNSAWPKISKVLTSFFEVMESILKTLQPYWNAFYQDFLVPFANILGAKILSGLGKLTDWLDKLKENLSDSTWVENTFGYLSEDIEKLEDALYTFDIASILSSLFDILIDTIVKADETFGISEKLQEMLSKVLDIAFGIIAPVLVEKIKQLWNEWIKPNIPGWVDSIWGTLQPYAESLGTKIVEKIIEFAVSTIVNSVPAAFSLNIGEALAKLFTSGSTEEGQAKSLGRTIVDCIINGFVNYFKENSVISKIYNAIKGAVENAVNKISINIGGSSSNPNDTSPIWSQTPNTTAAFASGGYVYAKPGGVDVTVAEGGEGEYIFGDSKLRKAIREELGNQSGSQVPIILQLPDGTELGSWMIDLLRNEVKRTGLAII